MFTQTKRTNLRNKLKQNSGQILLESFGGIIAVVALIVGLIWFFGVTYEAIPVDKIGLHYSGGMFQGTHFIEVVQPGTHTKYYGEFEKIYKLPSTQRNYIISKDAAHGDRQTVDFLSAPSSDNVPFTFEGATYFKLNPNPKVIRQFFEQICLHDNCWNLSPGKGWDQMLDQYFRPQIENALRVEAPKYDREHLYRDPATLLKIQQSVAVDLKERINAALGGEFFCGPDATATRCPDFSFVLKNPSPPDNVVAAYGDTAAAAQQVVTAKNNAEAKAAAAQGDADAQRIRASAPALTDAQLDYIKAQAMQACATNNNCTLIFTNPGTGVNVNTGK